MRLLTALVWLLTAAAASAAPLILSGAFGADDSLRLFRVTLNAPGLLSVRSAGYGGDTPLGIAAGGFDTVLSLFALGPNGLLLGLNSDADCGTVSPDPSTGACWDAALSAPLTAGAYVVALTQYDNLPLGPTFADGFTRTGAGNFTPSLTGFPGVSFLDLTGSQRTANWTLIFDGDGTVETVPEPGSLLLVTLTVAALWARRRSNAHR